jgi:heptosyltransferase-2
LTAFVAWLRPGALALEGAQRFAPDERPSAVLIDPSFVGDAVFAAPAALALVDAGWRVGVVVRPPADVIARRYRSPVAVHVFDKRGADRGLAGLRRFSAALRAERYAVALVPHPSLRSAFLARWAGIPRRVGLSDGASGPWFTERIPAPQGLVERRSALAHHVLGPGSAPHGVLGVLARRADPDRPGPRAGLCLGANFETKRWPARAAIALVDGVREVEPTVTWVLLGSEAERGLYAPLVAHLEARRVPYVDALGGGLGELVQALESCRVVVGGDTGPVHVARGLGIPVVLLEGPTSGAVLGLGAEADVVTMGLACQPCSKHGDRRCPLGHHACLSTLPGERVAAALLSRWAQLDARAGERP